MFGHLKIVSYTLKGILAITASIIYIYITRNVIWSHTYKIPYKKLDFCLVMNSNFFSNLYYLKFIEDVVTILQTLLS